MKAVFPLIFLSLCSLFYCKEETMSKKKVAYLNFCGICNPSADGYV
ncbi:hypothetical protein KAW50_01360 [candidate division WOR-3 bacterium]|nr:hypothetical protein [candidate division WOR-3 bacterium]